MKRNQLCALVAFVLLSAAAMGISAQSTPQTTAFTYQGQLNAGGTFPTGQYQFTFTLFDASSGGAQVVGTSPIPQNIQVVDGLFTTDLDFGQIFNGTQYWLDIQVGTTTGNEEELLDRQPINAVPVAQYALNSPAGKAGLVFAANVLNPGFGSSFFFPPNGSGDTSVGGNWVAFDQVSVPMPTACTFDRLYLYLSAVPQGLGGGGQITATLYVNDTSTLLAATADSSLGAASANATGSVPVNLGDAIAVQASGNGIMAGQAMISATLHCL
jgi:hypothetical protein